MNVPLLPTGATNKEKRFLLVAQINLDRYLQDWYIGFHSEPNPHGITKVFGKNDLKAAGLITFSRPYLKTAPLYRFRELVLHETAHAIAYTMHGPDIEAHGEEWRLICRELGIVPRETSL